MPPSVYLPSNKLGIYDESDDENGRRVLPTAEEVNLNDFKADAEEGGEQVDHACRKGLTPKLSAISDPP